MRLLDRITGRRRVTPAAVELALAAAFDFLVTDEGFELGRSQRFDDGASLGYRDRSSGVAILVLARASRGVAGWIGSLDPAGRFRPLNPDTLVLGQWRDLASVGVVYPENDDLFVSVLAFGAALRKTRRAS